MLCYTDFDDNLLWLKNNQELVHTVIEKWTQTSSYKYNKLISSEKELFYFHEYPAISDPYEYQLISIKYIRVLIN